MARFVLNQLWLVGEYEVAMNNRCRIGREVVVYGVVNPRLRVSDVAPGASNTTVYVEGEQGSYVQLQCTGSLTSQWADCASPIMLTDGSDGVVDTNLPTVLPRFYRYRED